MGNLVNILFHGGLTDFLPKVQRDGWISYQLYRTASVKDVIEALGVPHPEVGQILLNGSSIPFSELLVAPAQLEVFPVEPEVEGNHLPPLQVPAPRPIRFVLDVHLGKLARYLRLLGFDARLDPNAHDQEIAQASETEKRVILTRDVGLLKQKSIEWGYWIRSQNWQEQIKGVLTRYGCMAQVQPFTRCMVCNGTITQVPKQ